MGVTRLPWMSLYHGRTLNKVLLQMSKLQKKHHVLITKVGSGRLNRKTNKKRKEEKKLDLRDAFLSQRKTTGLPTI